MTTNIDVTTTFFIGNHYEVISGVITKYYYAGSQRIAMRKNGTLNYILGDHLGSTSIVTDASGNVINQNQYKAWGETRYTTGTEQTKYQYMGQYSYASDFGLLFYNARWYDSSLSRFAQADTVVPGGVQWYDRYAYVKNNPVKYTDPSGHDAWWCENASCRQNYYASQSENAANGYLKLYGVATTGASHSQKVTIGGAAILSGEKFAPYFSGTDSVSAFKKAHGDVSITTLNDDVDYPNCETVESTISCHQSMTLANTLHEFGHVFENYNIGTNKASDLDQIDLGDGNWLDSEDGAWYRETDGFINGDEKSLEHPHQDGESYVDGKAKIEQFGDMYMNWILDGTGDVNHGFTTDLEGNQRRKYMNEQHIPWVLGLR